MSNFQKILLQKADSFSTFGTTGLYTSSSTFDSTETSMYAEVISLASSTGYGGASLANQTERYLFATTSFESPSTYDVYTSFDSSHMSSSSQTIDGYLSDSLNWTVTPSGHDNFTSLQSSLEDDGKHFITYQNGNYYRYILLIDKNNLANSSSGSGSSSAADTSLISWAYSSQTNSDPNQIIGWDAVTPTIAQQGTPLDWRTNLRNKITSSTHDKETLIFDYLVDEEMKRNYTFHEYLAKKGI